MTTTLAPPEEPQVEETPMAAVPCSVALPEELFWQEQNASTGEPEPAPISAWRSLMNKIFAGHEEYLGWTPD